MTGRTAARAPRRLAAAALVILALGSGGQVRAEDAGGFGALAVSLWPEAERAGVSRALFDATFAGLTPDPTVAALTRRQPEFSKPIGAYLASQVTPARVAAGRALLAAHSTASASASASTPASAPVAPSPPAAPARSDSPAPDTHAPAI